jgi:hypothetical protein
MVDDRPNAVREIGWTTDLAENFSAAHRVPEYRTPATYHHVPGVFRSPVGGSSRSSHCRRMITQAR